MPGSLQVKLNVQRTLAIELQKLSIQFRKQQKQFLKKVSQKEGVTLSPSSLSVLDDSRPSSRGAANDDDFDPGFSDLQVVTLGLSCSDDEDASCRQHLNVWTSRSIECC